MNIVGYIFLALIAVGIIVGLGFFLASIPDIARYSRIRKM
jgi:hypothetical protein